MFPCELHCTVWHKPSPISAPGVPAYLVEEPNASIVAILAVLTLVIAAGFVRSARRRLAGEPKFTD